MEQNQKEDAMRVFVFNHQDKARAFIQALDGDVTEFDGARVPLARYDVCLTDQDVFRHSRLEALRRAGCHHFFVYPHDAGPPLENDVYPGWEYTTARFVTTQQHKEIVQMYGYNKPIHVIGWHLCEQKAFGPTSGERVLFAPIHPRCDEVDQEANRATFDILGKLASAGKIKLTVRHIGELKESGLKKSRRKNVEYVEGSAVPSVFHIDHADIVVGHLTFAYLAVARGKPTVFFGTEIPHHQLPKGQPVQYARHWNDYADLLTYPHDIGLTADPHGLMQELAQSDASIADWRDRMIGEPFDGESFVELLYQYMPKPEQVASAEDVIETLSPRQIAMLELKYGRDRSRWPKPEDW